MLARRRSTAWSPGGCLRRPQLDVAAIVFVVLCVFSLQGSLSRAGRAYATPGKRPRRDIYTPTNEWYKEDLEKAKRFKMQISQKRAWRIGEPERETKRELMNILLGFSNHRPAEIERVVARLLQEQMLADEKDYCKVITAYGRLRRWRECRGVLVDMERRGFRPTLMAYNTVLKALTASGRWEEAIQLIGEMWSTGEVVPNGESYAVAITVCGRNGKWIEALQLLEEMVRAGIPKTREPFTAAVVACTRAGEWRRALMIFEDMARDPDIALDVQTYTAAMDACAGQGKLQEVLHFMDQARQSGIFLDDEAYAAAMKACMNRKDGRKALELIVEMGEEQVTPGTTTYNNAITALHRSGMDNFALEMLDDMRDMAVAMDKYTFTTAIAAAGNWQGAMKLLDEMMEKGIMGDARVYTAAVSRCAKDGEIGTAMDLVRSMEVLSLNPDLVPYNIIMKETDKWTEALGLLDTIFEKKLMPDLYSYGAAIKSCRGPHWQKCVGLLEEMHDHYVMPDRVLYESVLETCERNGQWEQVVRLLKQMRARGLHPGPRSVNIGLVACQNAEKPQLFKELRTWLPEAERVAMRTKQNRRQIEAARREQAISWKRRVKEASHSLPAELARTPALDLAEAWPEKEAP